MYHDQETGARPTLDGCTWWLNACQQSITAGTVHSLALVCCGMQRVVAVLMVRHLSYCCLHVPGRSFSTSSLYTDDRARGCSGCCSGAVTGRLQALLQLLASELLPEHAQLSRRPVQLSTASCHTEQCITRTCSITVASAPYKN